MRQGKEHKQWKVNEEDWRNREKTDQDKGAVDEMRYRASTKYGPWTIIGAEAKLRARIQARQFAIGAVCSSCDTVTDQDHNSPAYSNTSIVALMMPAEIISSSWAAR